MKYFLSSHFYSDLKSTIRDNFVYAKQTNWIEAYIHIHVTQMTVKTPFIIFKHKKGFLEKNCVWAEMMVQNNVTIE